MCIRDSSRIDQKHKIRTLIIVPQLLEQAPLQLDSDTLQRYNRDMISILECFPKPCDASLLLSFNFGRRLVDTFF